MRIENRNPAIPPNVVLLKRNNVRDHWAAASDLPFFHAEFQKRSWARQSSGSLPAPPKSGDIGYVGSQNHTGKSGSVPNPLLCGRLCFRFGANSPRRIPSLCKRKFSRRQRKYCTPPVTEYTFRKKSYRKYDRKAKRSLNQNFGIVIFDDSGNT